MVNFDPSMGAEIQKQRPAVILNIGTVGRLPLKIVVPITDWKEHYTNYPWFVFLPADAQNSLSKDSGADGFQVKSISVNRFVEKLGVITDDQVDHIAAAVALCIGFIA